MIHNPFKIVLTSPGGRQFIRYKHRKADMLVEVFEFEGTEILKHHANQTKEYFNETGFPFVHSQLSFADKHYLLVAIDIMPHKVEANEEGFQKLNYPLRRLAVWYKYTYLLPKIKGELFTD